MTFIGFSNLLAMASTLMVHAYMTRTRWPTNVLAVLVWNELLCGVFASSTQHKRMQCTHTHVYYTCCS